MPAAVEDLGREVLHVDEVGLPRAFVGAAAFLGSGMVFSATLVSRVAGALLAYASELLGDVVEKALPSRKADGRWPPPQLRPGREESPVR